MAPLHNPTNSPYQDRRQVATVLAFRYHPLEYLQCLYRLELPHKYGNLTAALRPYVYQLFHRHTSSLMGTFVIIAIPSFSVQLSEEGSPL